MRIAWLAMSAVGMFFLGLVVSWELFVRMECARIRDLETMEAHVSYQTLLLAASRYYEIHAVWPTRVSELTDGVLHPRDQAVIRCYSLRQDGQDTYLVAPKRLEFHLRTPEELLRQYGEPGAQELTNPFALPDLPREP